jgi:transposase
MCPVSYYTMIRSKDNKFDLRLAMVKYAQTNGIKPAARVFSTSRNTVRKWLRRYRAARKAGLRELSRRPRISPRKTPPHIEAVVITARKATPGFGASRLAREFDLPVGESAIKRIIKQHGLVRKRRRKHHKKRDLRQEKRRYQAFELLQMDVKFLTDIPQYYSYMRALGLPKYEYTIRDVRTGAAWLAFSDEYSVTHSIAFIRRFLEHLRAYGALRHTTTIQTDCGGEFEGASRGIPPGGFQYTIEQIYKVQHKYTPPWYKNANAEVESFHRLIEDELFAFEHFPAEDLFWSKAYSYLLYFNYSRPNSYKDWKAPVQILRELEPEMDPEVLALPPLDLEAIICYKGGHHVSSLPAFPGGFSRGGRGGGCFAR